ncbi:uncharacterized protein LOC144098205 [Amblyomma americanum]
MSRQRDKRDSTCFVPRCKRCYRYCKVKCSLFRTPKDAEKRRQWERNIKHGDRVLDEASVVCERHFELCFIERSFKTVIQGKVAEILRDVPQLAKDAVPTLLPEAPNYISKPLPRKRKDRNLCEQKQTPGAPPEKKKRIDLEAPVEVIEESSGGGSCDAILLRECRELQPPPPWTNVDLSDAQQITFAQCQTSEDGSQDALYVSRRVLLRRSDLDDAATKATVYIRGKKVKELDVKSTEEAINLLQDIAKRSLCPGCRLKPISKSFTASNGRYFAVNCSILSDTACIACKYLRKLTQNTPSRREKSRVPCLMKTPTSKSRAVRHMKDEMEKLRKALDEMKNENEQLSATEFERRVSGLPPKQQLAVRTCFEAAKRKSTKGMAYSNEWLLQCILMQMKRPKSYEHIRRHNILAVPGRTCVQKRIHSFKTGFGFNPNIFNALSEKSQHMDEFSLRGGIVFDEMKISEHLDVKSTGELEGFVDLAQFTPDSQKDQLSDHGMASGHKSLGFSHHVAMSRRTP